MKYISGNLTYLSLASIFSIVILTLFFLDFSSPAYLSDKKTEEFNGCYYWNKYEIKLTGKDNLLFNGKPLGKYSIVKPVGGKHGFLLELHDFMIKYSNGDLVANTPGGYSWDITPNQLFISAPPGYLIKFQKATCNVGSGTARVITASRSFERMH